MNSRNFPTIRLGLRLQLLALAVFLLAIPWLGFHYIDSIEEHLHLGQKQSLSAMARAAAAAMQEQPDAFGQVEADNALKRSRDLYAYELNTAPQLDGRVGDWHEHLKHAISYGREHAIETPRTSETYSLSFDQVTGFHDDALYGLFRVRDDRTVYREINSISVHRNDNLQIALVSNGAHRRYTLATMQPGEVTAFNVAPRERGGRALSSEPRIRGYWRATAYGYNLEIKIPLGMIEDKLGFAIADVDSQETRDPVTTLGTCNIYDARQLGTIMIPSGLLDQKLRQLGYRTSSVHVLDRHRRIMASVGDITTAHGIWQPEDLGSTRGTMHRFLAPLFERILPQPSGYFIDRIPDAANMTGNHIDLAIKGSPATTTRPSSDGTTTIMSAAHPIIMDSEIQGTVVVEQTTNGIITLRNRAIENLLTTSIMAIIIGVTVLLLVGSTIAGRIRRLRHRVEDSIDTQGRVRHLLPASTARDEIGDLSRSFTDMVSRLKQYNTYLEDMSRRLAHELRTPVTVVRSSLDNLSMQEMDEEKRVYVERANEGVQRLASILTSMSEATRLEETLDTAEQEKFDLTEVVSGCVQGYEIAYPDQPFVADIETGSIRLDGIPDLIAQMLDKLVSNAVEFARDNTPVKVRLTLEADYAVIRVINDGPGLPDSMRDRLFDSMVSVRDKDAGDGSHLGLGLYIARIIAEFHGGYIHAGDREDARGVIVTVQLPVIRLTGRRV